MYDNKPLKINHIIAALLTIILGTVMHFVYDWTGQSMLAGFFAPINESTWEHLKLLFYPMLLISIFEYYTIGHRYDNYIFATSMGILAGITTILVIFYTYTGIIGQNFFFMDLICFIAGVCIAYLISYAILTEELFVSHNGRSFVGLLIILILVIAFSLFTVKPLTLPLFIDPTAFSKL